MRYSVERHVKIMIGEWVMIWGKTLWASIHLERLIESTKSLSHE